MINIFNKLVSSFYKYIKIENPLNLRQEITNLCNSLDLKGRILVGEEGINGSICGDLNSIKKFQETIIKNPLFHKIQFKDQPTDRQVFRKLVVRVRKEIVHFGTEVDLSKTAPFISPKELNELIEKDEIVLLDARNNYESRIGKFRNAVTLDVKNFRDFPGTIKEIEHLKSKKIVAYCTGGIRCEKASAFLRENGFENVMQLKGGILAYGKEFPDAHWQGKCFVFDERLAISFNSESSELSACQFCGKDSSYLNCHNLNCDKLFLCCSECMQIYNASCSEECAKAPNRRKKNVTFTSQISQTAPLISSL